MLDGMEDYPEEKLRSSKVSRSFLVLHLLSLFLTFLIFFYQYKFFFSLLSSFF